MTKNIDILFTIDITGSMYPAISEVRRELQRTCTRLFNDIPGLRIGFITHKDYWNDIDGSGEPFYKIQNLTNDLQVIDSFINGLKSAIPNIDNAECYEFALYKAQSVNWRNDAEKVVVVIGDSIPHEKGYLTERHRISSYDYNFADFSRFLPAGFMYLDWRQEVTALRTKNISIYGVQALGNHYATEFYENLARLGNGYKVNLNQLSHINETIIAICYKQSGEQDLINYGEELRSTGKLNRSIAEMIAKLSGGKIQTGYSAVAGLEVVPPYRFQILNVDARMPIKKFVEQTGATFKIGKGFYQLSKSEEIQEKKEVVLVDKKTGDMYSGAKARKMIGLPYGERGNISPTSIPDVRQNYNVFVQSTSNNRVLIPNTLFLYENDEN